MKLIVPNTLLEYADSHPFYGTEKFTVSRRQLSSQATDAGSKNKEEIEDPDVVDGDSVESETDDNEDELELSGTETVSRHKKLPTTNIQSQLFKAIVSVSDLSVDSTLNNWVEKGKELSRQEIVLLLNSLRRRRMYGRALQVNQSNCSLSS